MCFSYNVLLICPSMRYIIEKHKMSMESSSESFKIAIQNFLNPNKSKGRESCIHLSCKCCPNLFRHLAQKGYLYCTERYSNYIKFRMF